MEKEFANELLHNHMVSGWWLQVTFMDKFYEPYIAQYRFHFDVVIVKRMEDPVMILKEELIDQINKKAGTLGALHVYVLWLQKNNYPQQLVLEYISEYSLGYIYGAHHYNNRFAISDEKNTELLISYVNIAFNRFNPRLIVGPSNIGGIGLFSGEVIAPNVAVAQYGGVIIARSVWNRYKTDEKTENKMRYNDRFHEWEGLIYSEYVFDNFGGKGGEIIDADIFNQLKDKARWANSSIKRVDNNVEFDVLDDKSVVLVSTKQIGQRQEILLDYGVEYRWELARETNQLHLIDLQDVRQLLATDVSQFTFESHSDLVRYWAKLRKKQVCVSCMINRATLEEEYTSTMVYCSKECQINYYYYEWVSH